MERLVILSIYKSALPNLPGTWIITKKIFRGEYNRTLPEEAIFMI